MSSIRWKKPGGKEFGRRPYVTPKKEYNESMLLITDKMVYDLTIVKQSEFKKPYLADDYPAMEYEWPPGPPWNPPPYPPPWPPGPIPPDNPPIIITKVFTCSYNLCYCPGQKKCGTLNCTYPVESVSVTSFDAGDGSFTGRQGRMCITAAAEASGEIEFRVTMVATDRGAGNQLIKTKGIYEGHISECPEEECGGCGCGGESIGYTTQQMACSASQTFTVNNPKTGCTYTWGVLSGGGSITSGGVYTAPATNSGCTNNAVIALYCESTNLVATLAVAIQCDSGTANAIWIMSFLSCDPDNYIVNCYAHLNTYQCDGVTQLAGTQTIDCDYNKQVGSCYPVFCTCDQCKDVVGFGACGTTGSINTNVAASPKDVRTPSQITNGCCPAIFL